MFTPDTTIHKPHHTFLNLFGLQYITDSLVVSNCIVLRISQLLFTAIVTCHMEIINEMSIWDGKIIHFMIVLFLFMNYIELLITVNAQSIEMLIRVRRKKTGLFFI